MPFNCWYSSKLEQTTDTGPSWNKLLIQAQSQTNFAAGPTMPPADLLEFLALLGLTISKERFTRELLYSCSFKKLDAVPVCVCAVRCVSCCALAV